ncbi:uncharacterized protein PHACADRAFT_262827 [Phanerochaete carnosa HHB-10118-sp]|uniref:Uncharacterized protein n=1 Tax=Phanerochaete carnosa (strain HHB-10118-sp) TaxID=650164 RepID=K5WKZ2_PHACS|nr:uncharacterized protein PHACADRAFT_262827 [Phanerochaete carnosa HHB-10118-sp]EKM50932.1 hypothetical protein PHACADRAFT_262827 [Phanerochaete carnosa HHB-10118-sp]
MQKASSFRRFIDETSCRARALIGTGGMSLTEQQVMYTRVGQGAVQIHPAKAISMLQEAQQTRTGTCTCRTFLDSENSSP